MSGNTSTTESAEDLPLPPIYDILGKVLWIALLLCVAIAAITFAPLIANLLGGAIGFSGGYSLTFSDLGGLTIAVLVTVAIFAYRLSIKRTISKWSYIQAPGTITAPTMVTDVGSELREARWAAEIILWFDSEPLRAQLEEKIEDLTGVITNSFRLGVRELGNKVNRKRLETYLFDHNKIPGLTKIQLRNFRQQQVRRSKSDLI